MDKSKVKEARDILNWDRQNPISKEFNYTREQVHNAEQIIISAYLNNELVEPMSEDKIFNWIFDNTGVGKITCREIAHALSGKVGKETHDE